MAIAKLEIASQHHPLLRPESKEKEGISYPTLAAKALVVEYLTEKRPYLVELAEKEDPVLSAEDAYSIGKMEGREKVLNILGQGHVLFLNSWPDLSHPPLRELKPISQNEIEELLISYSEARRTSGLAKSIGTITPEEARAKGQMRELARGLINMGQGEIIRRIDEKIDQKTDSVQNSVLGELQ